MFVILNIVRLSAADHLFFFCTSEGCALSLSLRLSVTGLKHLAERFLSPHRPQSNFLVTLKAVEKLSPVRVVTTVRFRRPFRSSTLASDEVELRNGMPA